MLLLLFVVSVVFFCFEIFRGVWGGTRCFKLFLVDLVSQTCLRLSQFAKSYFFLFLLILRCF